MVLSRDLPSCSPVIRDARLPLPSRGSLGLRFPTFDGTLFCEDCHPARLRSLRLSLASRYLACFRDVRGVPYGLATWWKPPGHARAFGRPVPLSGNVARRQVVLPSSQVTPMNACPALRPRWCPRHSPSCAQDCCLPATGNRRRSPRYVFGKYPVVHDYTYFGAQSHGLHPRYTQLRTPPLRRRTRVRY